MAWSDGRAYLSLTIAGERRRMRVSATDVAQFDGLRLVERERATRERRALVADLRMDERMQDLERMTQELVRAELEALGYHRHKGEWRARRGGRSVREG